MGIRIGDEILTPQIMSCFVGFTHEDDGETWLRITDQRSGEEWDEPIFGWTYYLNSGGYYQHRDGRIVKPEWTSAQFGEWKQ